jgi:DNA mismatch repair protein MutS
LGAPDKIIRPIGFEILARAEKNTHSPSIIEKNTWKDLDLLNGSEEAPRYYLGNVLNRACTQLGAMFFYGEIARPTDDVEKLKKRQILLKQLVGDSVAVADKISEKLKTMKDGERQLLSLWNEQLQLPGTLGSKCFRGDNRIHRWCDKSSTALEASSTLVDLKKIASTAIQAISIVALPTFALMKTGLISMPSSIEDPLTTFDHRFIGQTNPLYGVANLLSYPSTQATLATLAGGLCAINIRDTYSWTKADLVMDSFLQNKLVAIAAYYRNMKAIYKLLSEHSNITKNLEHFDKLVEFFNHKELQQLFTTLESWTFNSDAKFFFRRGNVLLAWNLLHEDENTLNLFEPALLAVAEIDAMMSIVKLYNERTEETPWCFPEYITHKAPYIGLDNFRNPMIEQGRAVLNTIELGGQHRQNALITGGNGNGKSTTLRSITESIIFAQSLGIAPAKQMILTPFSYVASCMNISDDIKGNRSLFQAQVDTIKNVADKLTNLDDGRFGFTILDEMFTGTQGSDATALAYATTETLGRIAKSINMVVTHAIELTQLEGRGQPFTNYKMDRFQLKKGIFTQSIGLEVAKGRGLQSEIVDRAYDVKTHLLH